VRVRLEPRYQHPTVRVNCAPGSARCMHDTRMCDGESL
jgi:hypothetical protein